MKVFILESYNYYMISTGGEVCSVALPKSHQNYEYIFHLGLIRIKTVSLSVGITEFLKSNFIKNQQTTQMLKLCYLSTI